MTAPQEAGNAVQAPAKSGVSARSIAQMAVFAALIGALGLLGTIVVPGMVPITAQTLGVMLAGAVLGPWRGTGAVALLLLVVALGVPLLSGGRGGLGSFVGPSSGYLYGWLLGAFLVGLIVHGARGLAASGKPVRWWRVALGAVVGGILGVYLIGVPVQSLITGMGLWETTIVSAVSFLPGDFLKAAVTVVVTMGLWRAYPKAFYA